MVGDGYLAVPHAVTADVGIASGAVTDVAVEAGGVPTFSHRARLNCLSRIMFDPGRYWWCPSLAMTTGPS